MSSMTRIVLTLLAMALLPSCNGGSNSQGGGTQSGDSENNPIVTDVDDAIDQNSRNNPWYRSGVETVSRPVARELQTGQARNIILFVGDGMSLATVTAARILDGQRRGETGEENALSFGAMDHAGLIKTYTVDTQVPDSAGTMTAIMSGVKTRSGVVGVDQEAERGNCASQRGRELVTVLELAELAGKSTGIVSTARITHATPAATYAKAAERGWEGVADMPDAALADGCEDIASQLINFEARLEARYPQSDVDGLEVIMGGGRRHFLPAEARFNSADSTSPIEGRRNDTQNLIEQWQIQHPSGQYVMDQSGFDALDTNETTHLLALFNESHMQYEADRINDVAGEPSLSEMTSRAIEMLDNQPKGFFLMVESGRIDHAHHAGSAFGALNETIELSRAVKASMDNTDSSDTLIIVTADHGHVFTMGGYAKRGNPILGPVIGIGSDDPRLASDGLPFTTLGYSNGRGFRNFGDASRNADQSYTVDIVAGRQDLTGINTQSSGFHQEALVPLSAETHSGEDVPVYAMGPGASLVSGTQEQHALFHIMNHAGALEALSNEQLRNSVRSHDVLTTADPALAPIEAQGQNRGASRMRNLR